MSQDFHDGVGQVAGGDINNYGVNSDKAESRCLVSAQRKELHGLRAKCEEVGDDPREIWRMVHAQLGVTTLSEISADQFPLARSTMQLRLRLAQLQEEADKRRLVGKILRAAEKDLKVEMNNFCELRFGRTQLKNLEKSQLRKTLEFVQQHQTDKQCSSQMTVPETKSLLDFYLVNKRNAAIMFLLGLLIGSTWF